MRKPLTATKSSPCSPQLEKAAFLKLSFFRQFLLELYFNKTKGAEQMRARLKRQYRSYLLEMAKQELALLAEQVDEEKIFAFLRMDPFPTKKLLTTSIQKLYYSNFVPYLIKQDIMALSTLDPKDQYPEARSIHRTFHVYVGPTNSGKTYHGLQALQNAASGVYLGPLRLLALEAQEELLSNGVPCSLLTGEEEQLLPDAKHIASTMEKANIHQYYDVAVIDECQMLQDQQRGHAWTRAILGIYAKDVYCCTAPMGLDILQKLIAECGDSMEVVETNRLTKLDVTKTTITSPFFLEPGDAIIAFSRRDVLQIAERLKAEKKPAAIIYGNLPYATRKLQVENFLSGATPYLVATDAIGMGMNLPIRRVFFSSTKKFDGEKLRHLTGEELRQIGGRAGRKGMYDCGLVGTTTLGPHSNWNVDKAWLASNFNKAEEPIQQAYINFTELIMSAPYDTLKILKIWKSVPVNNQLYKKTDVERVIGLIRLIRAHKIDLSKEQELKCAVIPFPENNDHLIFLFLSYCVSLQEKKQLQKPQCTRWDSLHSLETFYKELDLYYSFSKAFGYYINLEQLSQMRVSVSQEIHKLLSQNPKKA